jgi:hypothetical protein
MKSSAYKNTYKTYKLYILGMKYKVLSKNHLDKTTFWPTEMFLIDFR